MGRRRRQAKLHRDNLAELSTLYILLALFSTHMRSISRVRKSDITISGTKIETATEANEQYNHLLTTNVDQYISFIPTLGHLHVSAGWV